MLVEVPYGEGRISVNITDARLAGIVRGNPVPVGNDYETLRKAIENPLNSKNIKDLMASGRNILFIVNDATRPAPQLVRGMRYSKLPSLTRPNSSWRRALTAPRPSQSTARFSASSTMNSSPASTPMMPVKITI